MRCLSSWRRLTKSSLTLPMYIFVFRPCGDVFEKWEACVDGERKAGNDFVESCLNPTRALKECMEANPEYYGPLLEAEKEDLAAMDAEESASAQLEPQHQPQTAHAPEPKK